MSWNPIVADIRLFAKTENGIAIAKILKTDVSSGWWKTRIETQSA